MNSNPVANMQQLVSHWNTLMPKETNTKKRRRDESDNVSEQTQTIAQGNTTSTYKHSQYHYTNTWPQNF